MIPSNHQNRKLKISNACPVCGMDLAARAARGFVRDGETYCCDGCALGTGCTCVLGSIKAPPPCPGAIEQREPGAFKGNGHAPSAASPKETPARYATRKADTAKEPKRKRSVTKPRDSTRPTAQGRAQPAGGAGAR